MQLQLVAVVDRGAARPHACDLPRSAAGRRFRQQCLRAMYVLCSRAAEAPTSHSCLLQVGYACCNVSLRRMDSVQANSSSSSVAAVVCKETCVLGPAGQAKADPGSAAQVARTALPLFLARCQGMLQAHAEQLSTPDPGSSEEDPDDYLCMLEVLQLMLLPPAVADAAIPPSSSLQVR